MSPDIKLNNKQAPYSNELTMRNSEMNMKQMSQNTERYKHLSMVRQRMDQAQNFLSPQPSLASASIVLKKSQMMMVKSGHHSRVHRNSVQRSPAGRENMEVPPPLPAQNPKQAHLERMARY